MYTEWRMFWSIHEKRYSLDFFIGQINFDLIDCQHFWMTFNTYIKNVYFSWSLFSMDSRSFRMKCETLICTNLHWIVSDKFLFSFYQIFVYWCYICFAYIFQENIYKFLQIQPNYEWNSIAILKTWSKRRGVPEKKKSHIQLY